jgi:hypothetical protein
MWQHLRKLLIFAVSAPMALGGLYLLGAELLLVHHMYFRFVLAALVLLILGASLLWFNFIAPWFGIKGEG